jgi:hypothetical protein
VEPVAAAVAARAVVVEIRAAPVVPEGVAAAAKWAAAVRVGAAAPVEVVVPAGAVVAAAVWVIHLRP